MMKDMGRQIAVPLSVLDEIHMLLKKTSKKSQKSLDEMGRDRYNNIRC